MRISRLFVAAALAVGFAAPASAQFAKAEDAIKYRQSAFSLMAAHFGRIGAVVQGKAPYDAKATEANAALVATIAALPFAAFGSGTEKSDARPTKALPVVWSERGKFDDKAKAMQAAVGKLAEAAKGGNLDAIKVAFGDAGKSCKSCHDDFRAK